MSFEQSASLRSETYFTFFSPKVPCKILCPCTYDLQCSNPLLLLRNVVQESESFFSYVSLTWGDVLGAKYFCMWQGSGQVVLLYLYFAHSSILEFGRGHTIKQLSRASPDLCPPLAGFPFGSSRNLPGRSYRILQKRYLTTISCSALMVSARKRFTRCAASATSAALTAEVAAWPRAQARGDRRRRWIMTLRKEYNSRV